MSQLKDFSRRVNAGMTFDGDFVNASKLDIQGDLPPIFIKGLPTLRQDHGDVLPTISSAGSRRRNA